MKEKNPKADTTSEFFNGIIKNPVILGSGSLVDSHTKINLFLKESTVGAIIPRTTRLKKAPGRETHPSPHLDIDAKNGSLRNCEWTGNPIEYWRPYLEGFAESKRVIMSVSGREIEDCLSVCKEIDNYKFPLIEINISCAHSNDRHGFITRNEEHIHSVVKTLKDEGIKTPISLKLGHSDFILELAKIAQDAGVDAITAINTFGPVFDFDITSGKPKSKLGIAGSKGGLSGKSIFQIALSDVASLSSELKIPVIACGGVCTAEDIIKMIMAGACAVQIYTSAHLQGKNAPLFLNKTLEELESWLIKNGYESIRSVKGMALGLLETNDQMEPLIPKTNKNLCIGCGRCEMICLEDAIKLRNGDSPLVDTNSCIGCGACSNVCPTNAITPQLIIK